MNLLLGVADNSPRGGQLRAAIGIVQAHQTKPTIQDAVVSCGRALRTEILWFWLTNYRNSVQ